MSQPNSTAVSSLHKTSPQSQQASNQMIAPPPPPSPALQPNNNNSRRSLFVRCVIVAIVSLFVVIKVVYFIVWRILHPLPVCEVKSFDISVSSQNTDCYDIVFTIGNPNKKLNLLVMDHFEILVFHGKTRVSEKLMLAAESVYLNRNPVDFPVLRRTQKLESSFWNKREVNINVQVSVTTTFLACNWLPKREVTVVYCKDLTGRSLSEKQKGECSVPIVLIIWLVQLIKCITVSVSS